MKNIILLSGLIVVFSISSCKKGNGAPASSAALPKTYTEDVRSSAINSLITYNLTYDNKNRLVSMAATPEPSVTKFIYQYPDDKTVIMDLYNSDQLSIHEKFWLNGSSLIDSTFQYDDSEDTTTEKYYYDPNLLVTSVNYYDYDGGVSSLWNQVQYTYDNNGNALTQTDYSGTTSFTYYSDLPYTLGTGLPFVQAPKYFIKTTSSSASGTPVTATHYYTFDSSNRLIQDSAYLSGVDVIAVKSYTY